MSGAQIGLSQLVRRVQGKYQRLTARHFCQRPFTIEAQVPFISFTFDDFPRSAWLIGGTVLRSFGIVGTYYVSLGLMGKEIETGKMFLEEDLKSLVEQGHELGCHTFSHCHAWDTAPQSFEAGVLANRRALKKLVPQASFASLSYPIGVPRAQTKQRSSRYFDCCRGGGQTFNVGKVDLNYLSAHFIEQSRDNPKAIKEQIYQNGQAKGWLIFATHDISEQPTRWGCTPELFEDIVRYSVESGARILPVHQAYQALYSSPHSHNID